jgi:glycine dehydrogenase subunit 1
MRYIPNTPSDRSEMLQVIGKSSVDDLFIDIPKNEKVSDIKNMPHHPMSELELKREMSRLSNKNEGANKTVSFLGGGSYDHFIPSTVKHVLSRSELYTAYTPYQPEMSQGMLQAIFEYQSMICGITGMDACNASMYDGATALAEAASLAVHYTGRKTVLVSKAVNPNYRKVLKTYAEGCNWDLVEFGYIKGEGVSDFAEAKKLMNASTACVILQSPNFFGCIEDVEPYSKTAKDGGTLTILSVDPISLGILKKPSEFGVDVVVGEGQSLGLPQSFGGPYLGLFTVKKDYLRLIPGRIVGETVDAKGRRGFVLTLQAREQHIRREKAFSNICSNEALCALAATVYLSTMGRAGLKEVADQCLQKAGYAKKKLLKMVAMSSPSFKEFVVKLKKPFDVVSKELEDSGIVGGLDLEKYYPELKGHMLIAVTEMVKKEDIDNLVKLIS